jgi:hypothetical protein
MTPYDIIDYYNAVALELRPRDKNHARRNVNAVRMAARFLTWCRSNSIDPKLYVRGTLEWCAKVNRKFVPIGFMVGKKAAERWELFAKNNAIEDDHVRELHAEADQPVAARLSLRPHREKFKSFYVGREELCLRFREHSGGFHPQSEFCQRCPVAPSCRERIQ